MEWLGELWRAVISHWSLVISGCMDAFMHECMAAWSVGGKREVGKKIRLSPCFSHLPNSPSPRAVSTAN
jgi:hypothetical protein